MGCAETVLAALILRMVLAKACAGNDRGTPGLKREPLRQAQGRLSGTPLEWGTARSK